MKKVIVPIFSSLALCLLLAFSGCRQWVDENDLVSENCTNHCAIVAGQFVTNGGKSPLPGVSLTRYWNSDDLANPKHYSEKSHRRN